MVCTDCEDAGFLLATSPHGEFATACACRQRRVRSQRLERERRGPAIPSRFRDPAVEQQGLATLRSVARNRVLAYRRDLPGRIQAGKGLWLHGEVRTAKTVAAASIAREAHDAGYLVLFSSVVGVLARIKDAQLGDQHFVGPEPYDLIAEPDLLVLDDLDLAREEDWALPHLAAALRRRALRSGGAMVLTSDCKPFRLSRVWGWGAIAALREACGIPANADPAYVPPPLDPAVIKAARRARRLTRPS